MFNWLARLRTTTRPVGNRRLTTSLKGKRWMGYRPLVEQLEDRCVPSVDLQSTLALGNPAVVPNQVTSLTAQVLELTGSVAHDVILEITLPPGSTNVGLSSSFPFGSRDISITDNVVTCNVGQGTGPGRVGSVSLNYNAPLMEGDYPVTVSATTSDDDPNQRNNTVRLNQLVTTTQTDITVSMVTDSAPAYGQGFSYLITVTNAGPNEAANVTVYDDLPPGVTLRSFSIISEPFRGDGSITGGGSAVECTFSALPVGSSAVIAINVGAPVAEPGTPPATISNTVTASFAADYDTSNNAYRLDSPVVEPLADLEVDLLSMGTIGPLEDYRNFPGLIRRERPNWHPLAPGETPQRQH